MPTCFLVLGTPRSGTSAVAGILHRLGVFMGERLIPAGPMNEAGFYQDAEFEELFDDLPEWMPQSIVHAEGHERLRKLRGLIARRCALGAPWGVKFKHAALVLPDFVAACDCPVKLLRTSRSRKASVASLEAWSEPHDQDPEEVIDRARAAIDRAVLAAHLPVLTVNYDDMANDPRATVAAVAAFAGRPFSSAAAGFVNANLRHYR